jgi:hypothetical protein
MLAASLNYGRLANVSYITEKSIVVIAIVSLKLQPSRT